MNNMKKLREDCSVLVTECYKYLLEIANKPLTQKLHSASVFLLGRFRFEGYIENDRLEQIRRTLYGHLSVLPNDTEKDVENDIEELESILKDLVEISRKQ